MITQSRIPPFTRESLDLPVTWQTMNEIHIPLSYACHKILSEVTRQFVVFLLAIIPLSIAFMVSFRPFMHLMHALVDDTATRAGFFIAVVVVLLWLTSRLRYQTSLKRLRFLLHITPVLLLSLQVAFSGG